ncbi:long-chain fatty acid--CoA ligase [Acidithrix sp. C25]|uniref:Long-chain-fatty-acid--CoA ligase n=2 Tax=root TaxID=1 RepID=A0A0D8HIB2_9ACTN|nr:long-chain-fatty-acid--CoA ligase [Acidithrix ferrooxidans]CAG4924164.1 unnamed protein product [Acidithrix sp. C25]
MKSTMQESKLSVPFIFRHGEMLYGNSKILNFDGENVVEFTYTQVAKRAHALSGALRDLGVGKDDRVATFCFNHNQHLEAYLAIPSMGAILHTLNVRLFADQLEFIVDDAQDKVIIADGIVLGLLLRVLGRSTCVRDVIIVGGYDHSAIEAFGNTSNIQFHEYEALIANGVDVGHFVEPDDENDAAAMCYTSGTTGKPKGVVYSHRSTWLHSIAASSSASLGLSTMDRCLVIVPMFHANAWGIPYAAWMVGADMIMPGRFLQAAPLARMISELAPTVASGVPVIWNDLLHYAKDNEVDFSSVRILSAGGSSVPRSLIEGFRDRYNISLVQGWGMTETSPLCTLAIPPVGTDPERAIEYQVTAGRPVAGVEIRIVDAEGIVAPNDGTTLGEIQVSGPWIASSYYKGVNPESFDGGWLKTGDMGTIDAQGYLRITDRTKDVIKSGGEWISSVELENAIMSHPLVYEAAVIGVPDSKWDERPLACVVVAPGSELSATELSNYILKMVAKWWLPERWSFVDEIPKTSVGKFDKKVLRNLYSQEKLAIETI